MSDKNSIFRIAGVYTAIILGAGFASGQELNSFFVKFGGVGFLGLVAAGVIFALVGWATLELCYIEKITDYSHFVDFLLGAKLGFFMKIIVNVFLFVLFATMLSAGGAVVKEAFNVPVFYGVLLVSFLCIVTFMFDLRGLVEINAILAPVMVVGGIFIGLYTFLFEHVSVFSVFSTKITENWSISALTYASYNIVTAITVLVAMGSMVTKPKIAFWGGVLGGLAMTVLGVCLALPLFVSYTNVQGFEIPLLHIVTKYHITVKFIYLFILMAAIYTTAIANGYAFIESVYVKTKINKTIVKIAVTLCAIALSQIGFSTFVGSVYPLFGMFGFFEAFIILFTFFIAKTKKS